MSEPTKAFDEGIRDAEQLLKYFAQLTTEEPGQREVLKLPDRSWPARPRRVTSKIGYRHRWRRAYELMSKRDEAVHRSKRVQPGTPSAPDLVNKGDLRRAIGFFKSLVDATEKLLVAPAAPVNKA